MLDEKEELKQVISYLLTKNKSFSCEMLQEIIFTANIQHLLNYGRLINEIFKPSFMLIDSYRNNIVNHYEYLSKSDRKALDEAVLRNELDSMPGVIKILGI
jgi:hypothetical protein